jgi:hypothetical protein
VAVRKRTGVKWKTLTLPWEAVRKNFQRLERSRPERWKLDVKRFYRFSKRTVDPLIVEPPEMTQSVRKVCSPSVALHQFVVYVVFWPGDNVNEMFGELTRLPLK